VNGGRPSRLQRAEKERSFPEKYASISLPARPRQRSSLWGWESGPRLLPLASLTDLTPVLDASIKNGLLTFSSFDLSIA
jgi:hypothetical protein